MRKKRQVNRLLTSMLMSMVALSALSQANNDRPSLVVGIIIDQLRSDYIELLQSQYGEKGFNRLMRDGAYFQNVDFGVPRLDATSATAILLTGAYPNINGITADKVYNPLVKKSEFILSDPKTIGNFTNETFSPRNLVVSTLADELRMDNNGMGYVYAIAPNPQQSIIMAGHAGNCGFWINDHTGKWATTTFYKDAPSFMQTRNYQHPLDARLDTMSWTPLLPLKDYTFAPDQSKYYSYRYIFAPNDKNRIQQFKKSALVNEEVTSVAIDHLKNLSLGKRNQLDMLNIAYTATPYENTTDSDGRIELQDTYLRLDAQLARLMDYIDKNVGLQNTLIYVASTGYYDEVRRTDAKFNIPTGEFFPARAVSLLNMYLMAVYGNGNWVDGYDQQQIYLNRVLIKEKNIDLKEARSKASEFLRQMSGVAAAYTIDEIINNPVGEQEKRYNRITAIAHDGDVRIEIMPGWTVEDNTRQSTTKSKQVRASAISAPIFILAPQVQKQKITSVTDATLLAPTVARILRIRSPNAASAIPAAL